jgi:hypothetical protein
MRSSFLLPGQKPFESQSSISVQWKCLSICSVDLICPRNRLGARQIQRPRARRRESAASQIPASSCVNHVIAGRNGSGLTAEIHSPAMVRGTI